MTVKDFKEIVDNIADEVGCDGTTINAHNIQSSVDIWNVDDLDNDYELVEVITDRLGCGCACGIRLEVRKICNQIK